MKKRIEEYLSRPYSTIVVPDVTTDNESCYVAYHPELEGCMSHGNTPEEAICNLREVTELYISTLLDKGLDVPFPQGVKITWDLVSPIKSKAETDIYMSPLITPPIFSPVI
jgi:predicted RNase H-like HicB family nuclease